MTTQTQSGSLEAPGRLPFVLHLYTPEGRFSRWSQFHSDASAAAEFFRDLLAREYPDGHGGTAAIFLGVKSFWHAALPEIGYVDSGNLEGACVTAPAPAGWEGVEAGSEEGTHLGSYEAIEQRVLAGSWAEDAEERAEIDAHYASLIDAAPGPGSVRPWAFWWGLAGLYSDEVAAMSRRLASLSGSVGLSAAQRRLVGEGWRFKHFSQDGPTVALMESPGGVEMWVHPGGSKSFGPGTYSLSIDDGAAARVTREVRADRFEGVDGRVQGVDRG